MLLASPTILAPLDIRHRYRHSYCYRYRHRHRHRRSQGRYLRILSANNSNIDAK